MIERELVDFLLVSGCRAAINAGKEILEIYNASDSFNVSVNADSSVVIEADRVAHETIKETLHPTRIPIMSEEGRNMIFEERYSWDLYWLVDPLDGTIEFIQKNDEFVISIALMLDKKPIIGLIYAPTEDRLYFSDPDRGAFVIEDATRIYETISTATLFSAANPLKLTSTTKDELKSSIKVVVTRSHMDEMTNNIIEQLKDQFEEVEVINCGAAKKFLLIADGKADLYFRTTSLNDWDIAAGESIVKSLGAKMKSLTKDDITYNKKELVIQPFYVTSLSDLEIKLQY